MTDLAALKEAVQGTIDQLSEDLRAISLSIHGNPELGFQEHHAHRVLTDYLEQNGFAVTRGAYEMPTAFRAVAGSGRPVVAVLCEYDALPEIGHACGHNLMAMTGVAAGMGLKEAVGDGNGTVLVLGSPAEEGGGGKILMIEREVVSIFNNVGRDWEALKEALHLLTEEQLRAALEYAELHKDAIQERLRERDRWTPEEVWKKYPFTRPPWR